jgi:hypothetical protein
MHREIWQPDGPVEHRALIATYDRGDSLQEPTMNEDKFNMSMRKFLKEVGVTSQQEIEKAVRAAVEKGDLKGNEQLSAEMVLTIGKVSLRHKVDGTIELG